MSRIRNPGRSAVLLWALVVIGNMPSTVEAAFVVLSDNLTATSGGTEAASGSTWLTASFGTDASAYTLNSVTLLLANSVPGKAELDLYNDGGLQPGSLVGTLASPASYSSSLASTTFTTGGIALSASSTYWVVLKATSGEFDWSWTATDTGSGEGFQDTWGTSSDAGTTWFSFDSAPTQMSVTATISAVPTPTSLILFGAGTVPVFLHHGYRRWRSHVRDALPPSS